MTDLNSDAAFKDLLDRYRKGECTPEERTRIEAWLESIPEDNPFTSASEAKLTEQVLLNAIHERAKIQKETRVIRLNVWLKAAAAVLIFGAVGLVMFVILPAGRQVVIRNSSISDTQHGTDLLTFTGPQFVKLPDGTSVTLNDSTKISYHFSDTSRTVTLQGEAYFDVAHDQAKPFRVHTGEVVTTVLGTAFNISAYTSNIRVTVTRGRVQVGDGSQIYGIIARDQQISVNPETNHFIKQNTKAEAATAWKAHYLILDDVTLETAAAIVAEKYNTKIVFGNASVKACRFTATFLFNESLDQVLAVISTMSQANYEKLPDGTIRIFGKGCD